MAFHPIDREADFLLPPSVQESLPKAHLARHIVAAKMEPLSAAVRDENHPLWRERFTEPARLVDGASPVATMKTRSRLGPGVLPMRYESRRSFVRHHQVVDGVPAVSVARVHGSASRGI
jgi:hypothetical protein